MTMPNRECVDVLKKEIDALRQESYGLQLRASKLSCTRFTTLGEIIKEEKLLAKQPWQFKNFTSKSLFLDAVGYWEDFPEVVELLEPDDHDNFCLGSRKDGPHLRFSDGAMYLELNRSGAKEIIQALGLTIDLSNLIEKQKQQQTNISELASLITLMKEIAGDESSES